MADTILVIVEQREGKLNRVSIETIAGAQAIAAETGWTLEAVGGGDEDGRGWRDGDGGLRGELSAIRYQRSGTDYTWKRGSAGLTMGRCITKRRKKLTTELAEGPQS